MNLFGHNRAINVPLTFDVMMKCKCVTCPVQANSACAKPKIAARMEMMKNAGMAKNMDPGMMKNMSPEDMKKMMPDMMQNTPKEQFEQMKPRLEDMPGPYCANGIAACNDLDFSKMCICNECQIYKDYNLMKAKPTLYFCKDGKAT